MSEGTTAQADRRTAAAAVQDRMIRRLVDLGRSLTPAQWHGPSLCDGWRACDVFGHMTYGGVTPMRKLLPVLLFKHRGNLARGSKVESIRYADAHPQHELIDHFERSARQPVGIGKTIKPDELHLDHVIHELDIRRAQNLEILIPAEEIELALDIALTASNPLFAPAKRAKGLRLRATDLNWAGGEGDLVEGPAIDLLLALGGRAVSVLFGPGSAKLAAT